MKVVLVIHVDRFSPNDKISHTINLSDQLEEFFESKSFGNSLNELYFGVVILSKTFRELHDLAKPKYIKSKKLFECEIEYDFEQFMQVDDSDVRKFIVDGIIKSLPMILDKVKDFDITAFENDLEKFRL